MRTCFLAVSGLMAASVLGVAGCRGQVPAAGTALSPDQARRVEILIRQRAKMTPDATLIVGPRQASDVPGYDRIDISVSSGGQTYPPITFLLSKDGRTLAQLNKYDISKDPRAVVSGSGRPGRGGSESAPVEIVGFDDLECPYCAKMHRELFPALTERYGDQVRIVYKDFPLSQHPWAMRAAVDTNCVGAHSATGYWNLVDYIHAHAGELGGAEKSVAKAHESLDQLSRDEAKKQGLKPAQMTEVEACLKKQDESGVKTSLKVGESLDIEATPVLFINGEKFEGAYPVEDVFRMVDAALVAAGKTPPPAYVVPVAKDGK